MPTVAAGALGYFGASALDRGISQQHANAAAGYERCLDFVNTNTEPNEDTLTIEVGKLASPTQADCGVDDITAGQRNRASQGERVDVPAGTLSGQSTQLSIELGKTHLTQAAQTEYSETGQNLLYVWAGAGTAGTIGFVVGAAGLVAWSDRAARR
jgi:hypothetical protein